ncbi:MAG: hypothetical protein PF689_12105 [Deltaproteobacteria bacterium]|jgi:hypothetical protein|nr:hypothetical protein [Deltaproteobacteria bacterium]
MFYRRHARLIFLTIGLYILFANKTEAQEHVLDNGISVFTYFDRLVLENSKGVKIAERRLGSDILTLSTHNNQIYITTKNKKLYGFKVETLTNPANILSFGWQLFSSGEKIILKQLFSFSTTFLPYAAFSGDNNLHLFCYEKQKIKLNLDSFEKTSSSTSEKSKSAKPVLPKTQKQNKKSTIRIVAVKEGKAYLNAGKNQGVKIDDNFLVYRKINKNKHTNEIAIIGVSEVLENYSISDLAPGELVQFNDYAVYTTKTSNSGLNSPSLYQLKENYAGSNLFTTLGVTDLLLSGNIYASHQLNDLISIKASLLSHNFFASNKTDSINNTNQTIFSGAVQFNWDHLVFGIGLKIISGDLDNIKGPETLREYDSKYYSSSATFIFFRAGHFWKNNLEIRLIMPAANMEFGAGLSLQLEYSPHFIYLSLDYFGLDIPAQSYDNPTMYSINNFTAKLGDKVLIYGNGTRGSIAVKGYLGFLYLEGLMSTFFGGGVEYYY